LEAPLPNPATRSTARLRPEPLLRIQSHLTDRDHTLLSWLADHGLLTSFQIAAALFPSLDFAQRRLRRLVDVGVLARFRPLRPDGGSYPYHYLLDQLGADIVAAQRGEDIPRRDHARRRRWHLTQRANLPHLLATNQFFIDLAAHARTHPGTSLDRWWPSSRCQQPGAFATDDASFDPAALAYRPTVRPDGHGVWTERDVTVPFFVEIDLSTEPIRRLTDKIGRYADLARVTGHAWPVLFTLESASRERHLHQRLTDAGVHWPIATTVRPRMVGHRANSDEAGPADAVWWPHRRQGALVRLADLASAVRLTRRPLDPP
jgi:predicted transcriptional regulator